MNLKKALIIARETKTKKSADGCACQDLMCDCACQD